MDSQHVSVHIRRGVSAVYDYARDPSNLPAWAEGLSSGIERVGDDWVSVSPMGTVTVEMAAENDLGVLDHWVTTGDGETFYNPMRVIEAVGGCEVIFTLRRQAGMSDDAFEADAIAIATDLSTLKAILEAR